MRYFGHVIIIQKEHHFSTSVILASKIVVNCISILPKEGGRIYQCVFTLAIELFRDHLESIRPDEDFHVSASVG